MQKRRHFVYTLFAYWAVLSTGAALAESVEDPTVPVPRMQTVKGKKQILPRFLEFHNRYVEKAKQGNVDIVFIGDSITEAWEDKASEGGWPGSPVEVYQKNYAKRHPLNLGISGDRTQYVLWRLDNGEVDGISPKLAVVLIGTNNIGSNKWEDIAAGVEAVVKKLRQKLPNTKVLLLGIFPRANQRAERIPATYEKVPAIRDTIEKINERISKLDDGKFVFYRDIGNRFLKQDGSIRPDLMFDFLHLTAKGFEVWADAIEPDVVELMGENHPKSAQ